MLWLGGSVRCFRRASRARRRSSRARRRPTAARSRRGASGWRGGARRRYGLVGGASPPRLEHAMRAHAGGAGGRTCGARRRVRSFRARRVAARAPSARVRGVPADGGRERARAAPAARARQADDRRAVQGPARTGTLSVSDAHAIGLRTHAANLDGWEPALSETGGLARARAPASLGLHWRRAPPSPPRRCSSRHRRPSPRRCPRRARRR